MYPLSFLSHSLKSLRTSLSKAYIDSIGFGLEVAVKEDLFLDRIDSEICEDTILILAMIKYIVRTLIYKYK